MKTTGDNKILAVVRRMLSAIDPRLVEHGERVAYLAAKTAELLPEGAVDIPKLLVLSALHDVGAYKTEEIDDMVSFETRDVSRHAVYGYLFLKNMSGLGDAAEAVLYHHTPYKKLASHSTQYAAYAALIHVCDRADIVKEYAENVISELEKLSGTMFSKELVERFACAEEKLGMLEKIKSGVYREEFELMLDGISKAGGDVTDYLRMLVYAIDFQSEATVTHTSYVVAYAEGLGRAMGLDENQIERLKYAAFVHDIGKIATPVDILEKPGKLNDDEMETMKLHVVRTEEILRDIVDDDITDMAARHHEKLNGRGYPRGLSAKELNCPQRILAVADVLSALTGKRSYKEAFTKQQTLNILRRMSERGELCSEVIKTLEQNYDALAAQADVDVAPTKELYGRIRSEYGRLIKLV